MASKAVPAGRASLNDALIEAGFVFDADATTVEIETAEQCNMNRGGPYEVMGCYRRDKVTVKVEQNTDTRSESGMSQMTTYPEVFVVEGPRGRVACSADLSLILAMADELA